MAYTKGSIQPGSAKARILELLADKPAGMHSRQIALTIDISEQRANNACYEMGKFGMVIGVHDGCSAGKATRQKRWCLPQHEATTREASKSIPAKATVWKKTGVGRLVHGAATAPITGAKVTICPSFVDRRYTPDHIEPFFSAMTPGSYLHTGSAIERAYGGGK